MPVVNNKSASGNKKKGGNSGSVSTGGGGPVQRNKKSSLSSEDDDEGPSSKCPTTTAAKGSSTSSNSSSSSSSSTSSSESSSEDSSSSSSGSNESSSSAASQPKTTQGSADLKDKQKVMPSGGVQRGRRSASQSSRSRASSAAGSCSSISSASSTRSKHLSTKKVNATSTSSASPANKMISSGRSKAPTSTTSPSPVKNKSKKSSVVTTSSSMPTSTTKTLPTKGSNSGKRPPVSPGSAIKEKKKVKKPLPAESKGETDRNKSQNKTESKSSTTATSSTTTKSKLIKSGTVTNTKPIKPLMSSTLMKKKPGAGNNSKGGAGGKTSNKGPSASTSSLSNKPTKKHSLPIPLKQPKLAPAKKSVVTKQQTPPVVSTTSASPPIASRLRNSSCSSSTGGSSSSSANNSSNEDDDQPMRNVPIKSHKSSTSSAPKSSSLVAKGGTSESSETPKKKVVERKKTRKKVPVAPVSDLLSSAEDESESKLGAENKKKLLQQRRPVTRRQKSGNKKTIPTTTIFNQSLLLAAANSTSSPTGTPKKSPKASGSSSLLGMGASVASSSSAFITELPMTPMAKSSHIISRHSNYSSSANTSESESERYPPRSFPLSTLTTSSSVNTKNRYISTWDSDFSDDNYGQQPSQSANCIRVPAKTSNKPRPIDWSLFDPETFEPPRCPFPSCDSTGHLSGRYSTHNFLSCCPRYHGFEAAECAENNEERSRRECERSRYRNILSTPGKKPPKQTSETKSWVDSVEELKKKDTKDKLVSEYDALLWKDALAIAADRIEREQSDGLSTQGIYCRMSMAVAMGRFEMKCWCASPYPEPLSQNRRLFVCEFCLKPVGSGTVLRRHCAKCVWRHPPGDEIYRKERLSVWEVDGKKQKTYCQNLCLLAKCFLDHKTLYLDVDPFLFYVMTLADSQGCHIVGYFSKEKNSFLNYNVSCILTLPPYQRQGFGRLLIDFSYLLTRVEGKIGSPEKPLSDLGLISYRSYWKDAVLRRLCACASREFNIKDLSIELGVSTADLISTLQFLGMLKYWKGKHLVLKKQDVLEEYLERVRRRGNEQRQIDPCYLRWRPYQPPPDENSSEEKS